MIDYKQLRMRLGDRVASLVVSCSHTRVSRYGFILDSDCPLSLHIHRLVHKQTAGKIDRKMNQIRYDLLEGLRWDNII